MNDNFDTHPFKSIGMGLILLVFLPVLIPLVLIGMLGASYLNYDDKKKGGAS